MSSPHVGRLIPTLVFIGAVFAGVCSARADDSLARYVPADVGLFIELRGADDLLRPLTEAQIWLTLADFAGQPARPDEPEEWRQRLQQTIHMTPDEAIHRLLSQRMAFVAESPRRAQDAIVLCRPAEPLPALVRSWAARPLPTAGRTAVYRLPNNVGVAVHGDLLMLGDDVTPGMFPHVLRLLESGTGTALADDPVYERLLARVPKDPDGVFFLRMGEAAPTSAPATAPAATAPTTTRAAASRRPRLDLPGPLRDSSNVLLALHRDGRLLRFSAVGDAARVAPPPPDGDALALLGGLPERTLLAWSGHVDYGLLTQALASLPERNVLRVAYELQQRSGTVQHLMGALTPAACLAVGVVTPERRSAAAPPMPALGLVLAAREPAVAAAEWEALFRSTLGIYRLLSLRAGTPPHEPPKIVTSVVEGVEVERLDLGGLLAINPEYTPIGEIEFCWALDGNALILASHPDWMRQILAARHQRGPRLQGVLETTHSRPPQSCDSLFFAQSGPVADLGQLWLDYLGRTIPAVLDENWWRQVQPGGRDVRLGILVTSNSEQHRLKVLTVPPDAPAHGFLKVGDDIVGCNRRRFATSQPIDEMTRGLAERPDARWVDLLVEREGGMPRNRRIPLPFADPVQVLRRIVAIGHLLQRVVYSEDLADEAGPRGELTLELRGTEGPLFGFAVEPPGTASAPATQPVSPALGQSPPAPPAPVPSQPAPSTPPSTVPASQPAATTSPTGG